MIAVLLTLLFVSATLVAGAVLARDLRGVLGEAALARAALAACPRSRTVSYRISEVKVLRAPAQVLVLPVRQAAQRLGQPELRAAA